MSEKTLEQHFQDWHDDALGFGYGTGEVHIVPVLRQFLIALGGKRPYDHEELSETFSPVVTWLLINLLCKEDMIEYGSSTRYGWLTSKGVLLSRFMAERDDDTLIEIAATNDNPCYPNACNCGPHGYEKGRVCQNPFWLDQLAHAMLVPPPSATE